MLLAIRLDHLDSILPARAHIHLGQSHGEWSRRVPLLQLFRFRPCVVNALPRRADGAVDLDDRRRCGFVTNARGVKGRAGNSPLPEDECRSGRTRVAFVPNSNRIGK
jgi:hypothetical protein